MAKVTAKAKFDVLTELDTFFNSETVRKLGRTIVGGIKDHVAKGLSPVRDHKRFDRYSDSYTKTIKRGGIPGKTVRPVNLRKSGEMLDALDYKAIENGVEVGFFSGKPAEIAGYHQDGTSKMPMRRMIPDKLEEFTVSIQDDVKDVYAARVNDIIRRSNR